MKAIDRLLDAVAARCEPSNDSAVARRIGVTRAAVSAWRRGGVISECHLAALVNECGLDAGIALEVLKDQAHTDAQRVIWGNLWTRIMPIMSTVVLSARRAAARLGAHH